MRTDSAILAVERSVAQSRVFWGGQDKVVRDMRDQAKSK
jgi:hypothetical protein